MYGMYLAYFRTVFKFWKTPLSFFCILKPDNRCLLLDINLDPSRDGYFAKINKEIQDIRDNKIFFGLRFLFLNVLTKIG